MNINDIIVIEGTWHVKLVGRQGLESFASTCDIFPGKERTVFKPAGAGDSQNYLTEVLLIDLKNETGSTFDVAFDWGYMSIDRMDLLNRLQDSLR